MNTKQLDLWSGNFGRSYTLRNVELNFSTNVRTSMRKLFSEIFRNTNGVNKILEEGCNTGHNLSVLSEIGDFELAGIDSQASALEIGREKE